MATVVANKLELFVNPALVMLGAEVISTLGITSDYGAIEKLCAFTFNQIVNEVLMEANWVELLKRDTALTADSTHVTDEFLYGYDLPDDFVHLAGEPRYLGVSIVPRGQKHWRVRGTKLETDYQGPDILYVYNSEPADSATDEYYTLFGYPLRAAIIAKCMAAWADAVAGKDPIKYEQLYRLKLNLMRAMNAKQSPPSQMSPNTLMNMRQSHA